MIFLNLKSFSWSVPHYANAIAKKKKKTQISLFNTN